MLAEALAALCLGGCDIKASGEVANAAQITETASEMKAETETKTEMVPQTETETSEISETETAKEISSKLPKLSITATSSRTSAMRRSGQSNDF